MIRPQPWIMLMLVGVLLAVILFVLFFVRRGTALTVREALSNYLRAVRGGRTEESYHYLCAAYKAGLPLEKYRAENSLGSGLIAEMIGRHLSFTIKTVEETEGRAQAVVALTAPDYRLMIHHVFRNMAPEQFPEQILVAFTFLCRRISFFLDNYRQDGLPMQTSFVTFMLQREKDGWKIVSPDPGGHAGDPSLPLPPP